MADFHLLISNWYRQNHRDLPWRNTRDPYLIWLSEVILQQTRVDQGLSYYLKFAEHFPEVLDLAEADEQDVLKLWQGLGYYSRARNLHAGAKQIRDQFGGQFPEDFNSIRSLKGIGDYTAAAISSFAFDLPHAVVDGNVYRVLSRYFDINTPIDSGTGKKMFNDLAQSLIEPEEAATHNQAIMELGALVCTPRSPQCHACPLNNSCLALQNGTIEQRPVKTKRGKVKDRYFTYLIFLDNDRTFLQKRVAKDVWQHLFQFPLIESQEPLDPAKIITRAGAVPDYLSEEITHVLSHQKIHARFAIIKQAAKNIGTDWIMVNVSDIANYPLPRLIDRYLESNGGL
jgi:A/G-specific adenine glycosylase